MYQQTIHAWINAEAKSIYKIYSLHGPNIYTERAMQSINFCLGLTYREDSTIDDIDEFKKYLRGQYNLKVDPFKQVTDEKRLGGKPPVRKRFSPD